MTYEEAKRILHPDTTVDALHEILCCNGFNKEEAIKTVEKACIVACNAIDTLLKNQNECYKVEKKIRDDDNWYYEGTWDNVESLARAMFQFGKMSLNTEQIKVSKDCSIKE